MSFYYIEAERKDYEPQGSLGVTSLIWEGDRDEDVSKSDVADGRFDDALIQLRLIRFHTGEHHPDTYLRLVLVLGGGAPSRTVREERV